MKILNVTNVAKKIILQETDFLKLAKAQACTPRGKSLDSQNPKTFQPKNKGLVAKTFNWDEEEVFDDEEVTQVKVLMALADDELTVGKVMLAMCRDELLVLKQAKLEAVTFQIQNTELTKLNHSLQEQIREEKKKKVLGGELFIESSSKMKENENLFVPASIGQAVNESLKLIETLNTLESSKDSEAESLTPLPPLKNLQGASPSSEDSLDKSVSGTVTVNETEPITPSVPTEVKNTEQESKLNELTKLVQMSLDEKNIGSSKSLRFKPIKKPQLKYELCLYTNHSTDDCYRILYYMKCKREDHRTSDHEMYTASLKGSDNYKAQPYQYASPSKQILKAKAKPFLPCTHYGFNNHRPDDCRNYPECEICRSYDHFTSGHNHVIHIRGGVPAESS
ncbi:hypothetical protein Tco_0566485 [Tanacetum coccineum]